jgi:FolB domain-containing protein
MDQVIIHDLRARGIIGVSEDERQAEQDILINIIIFADLHQAGKSDELAHSIDYSAISKQALTIAKSAQRFTVEALAEDIARMCLMHPHVEKVRVRVEKPRAVRFAGSVGVEIERLRTVE